MKIAVNDVVTLTFIEPTTGKDGRNYLKFKTESGKTVKLCYVMLFEHSFETGQTYDILNEGARLTYRAGLFGTIQTIYYEFSVKHKS